MTQLIHESAVHTTTGPPDSWPDPIEPESFAGRSVSQLAKSVGVSQFGVNKVTLEPGSISALRHWHEAEDEFVYVLSGELVLVDDNGEHAVGAGSVVGFPAGEANGHHFRNRSTGRAVLLVVGSRRHGSETIHYPDNDLGPVRR